MKHLDHTPSACRRWRRRSHVAVVSSLLAVGVCSHAALRAATDGPSPQTVSAEYDLLLRGGHIVDGTGNPWFRGDLAIEGDRIARIAPRIDARARRVIDLEGQVIAPGFIDLHTHAIRGLFEVPTAENYVRQGVTTIMEGPDGSSPLPLSDFLDRVVRTRTSVNVGVFVGQGSIRAQVMGPVDRPATPGELGEMLALVREAMRQGAFGMSTGLLYVPGTFTPTAEVIELARVAGELGGIHTSHMRDEASGILDSVRETIAIGEQGHLPTHITHHKIVGLPNWGKSVESLALVAEARARGVDVTVDQYPYTAASNGIRALLPRWALEGGRQRLLDRLRDPATRDRVRRETAERIRVDRGGGDPARVTIAFCEWDPTLQGKSLTDITRERGHEATIENAAETTMDLVARGGARAIYHAMDEADLERILASPITMIASDGEVPIFGQAFPHPRSYGTFARVLGRYVREKGVLSLEDAVRKMTSRPAQRIGLVDRGVLRPGLKADLSVFDPLRVRDRATFEAPHQYAEGFSLVVVNGEIVFEAGRMTPARPGVVLYGPSAEPPASSAP